jgi:RimJ/RimL family protein N-acetyltransferase
MEVRSAVSTGLPRSNQILILLILTSTTSSKKAADESLAVTEKWLREKFTGPDVDPPFNFAAIEKNGAQPGRIIGIVGVIFMPGPVAGYMIHPDVWGKGYATEATRRVMDAWWDLPLREKADIPQAPDGQDAVDPDVLHAEIIKGNGASARVLEKCGFEMVREYVDEGDEIVLFKTTRPSR